MIKDWHKVIKALSIIGILLALYLLYEYIFRGDSLSPCYVNTVINCEASTKGPLALTLGIPTALYGLVGYSLILLGSVKRWPKLIFGMATFGMVFCLRITYIELYQLKVICPVCVACQIIMAMIFAISILLVKNSRAIKT